MPPLRPVTRSLALGREATPFGTALRFIIHDNDATFGSQFARAATATGIELLAPHRVPRANALCERFIERVRHTDQARSHDSSYPT